MLAVARAFQAHADGIKAGSVLDIITGRPEDFNEERTGPDGGKKVMFNSVRSCRKDGTDWPSIIMPVVAGTCDNVSYFFVQPPFEDVDGNVVHSPFPCGLGRFDPVDERQFEPDLSWLLPPHDEEQDGQPLRVPLHPAVCLHGTLRHFRVPITA